MIKQRKESLETLIDLNEPEALVQELKEIAAEKTGERWAKLADALAEIQSRLHSEPPAKTDESEAKPE